MSAAEQGVLESEQSRLKHPGNDEYLESGSDLDEQSDPEFAEESSSSLQTSSSTTENSSRRGKGKRKQASKFNND